LPLSIQTITVGPIEVNCYLAGDPESGNAILIDPGDEPERITAEITNGNWNITHVVATHGHFDHVMGVEGVVEATGAPFLVHQGAVEVLERAPEVVMRWFGVETEPPPQPDRTLAEGEILEIGVYRLAVSETPGHSPGGISLIGEGMAFVGDAVFSGSIGRTDLPGSDYTTLISSIESKLLPLEDGTILYPGHGPSTTIDREKRTNPFFLQNFD
jgi:glyoxylase-like metal-dependent hydrolase (beta-lactamase superfamily II)